MLQISHNICDNLTIKLSNIKQGCYLTTGKKNWKEEGKFCLFKFKGKHRKWKIRFQLKKYFHLMHHMEAI